MKLELLIASTLATALAGCASEPTPEGQSVKRIEDRYSEHREMRTAGGHHLVWNVGRVQTVFRALRAESGWDMRTPHRFGYTFVHNTPAPLRELSQELEHEGYHFARLELVPDDGQWWLKIQKEESHSPQSLHERNVYFSKMAEARNVLYDGWDVEKPHQK